MCHLIYSEQVRKIMNMLLNYFHCPSSLKHHVSKAASFQNLVLECSGTMEIVQHHISNCSHVTPLSTNFSGLLEQLAEWNTNMKITPDIAKYINYNLNILHLEVSSSRKLLPVTSCVPTDLHQKAAVANTSVPSVCMQCPPRMNLRNILECRQHGGA
jgi:hypothetical protein